MRNEIVFKTKKPRKHNVYEALNFTGLVIF
jgi:hypothetical protein